MSPDAHLDTLTRWTRDSTNFLSTRVREEFSESDVQRVNASTPASERALEEARRILDRAAQRILTERMASK